MAIATKRSQITLDALNELGSLASAKIGGGPYTFTKPIYVVADEAHLNSVATYHRTMGLFLRADVERVYEWDGSAWSDTGMRAFTGVTPSGTGTVGEMIALIADSGSVARKYVWRPEYRDSTGRVVLSSGWYHASTRSIVETIRSAVISLQTRLGTPIPAYFKSEHLIFGYQGQAGFSHIMPFRNGTALVTEGGSLKLRAYAELGNISYITSDSGVTVKTQVTASVNVFTQWLLDGTVQGDRNRAVCKFRLKHATGGTLTGSFQLSGYLTAAGAAGTWKVTGDGVGFSVTPGDRAGRVNVNIDSSWSGQEVRLECVYTPAAAPRTFDLVNAGNCDLTFTIPGASPATSSNTFGSEGYETVAIGCAMAGGTQGPQIEEGYEHPVVPPHETFEDGWRERNSQSSVIASQAGGIWRAIPFGMLRGIGTDPRALVDYSRSYFAPQSKESVSTSDGALSIATAVDGIVPRYPFLRTTDLPARRSINIVVSGFDTETFPGSGSIYSLSAHRVQSAGGALEVRVGYVVSGGAFRRKATLAISPGSRDSEVIYPGWWVLPNNGVTMAYECTEPVNIQALWVGQQRYSNPFDPLGEVRILPDAGIAALADDAATLAFIFNDLEEALLALP